MNLNIQSEKTNLDLEGVVSDSNIFLKSKKATISLDDFKHFSGVSVLGDTAGEISFLMDKGNSYLNYRLSWPRPFVSDYYIGDSEGDLLIDFKNEKIKDQWIVFKY